MQLWHSTLPNVHWTGQAHSQTRPGANDAVRLFGYRAVADRCLVTRHGKHPQVDRRNFQFAFSWAWRSPHDLPCTKLARALSRRNLVHTLTYLSDSISLYPANPTGWTGRVHTWKALTFFFECDFFISRLYRQDAIGKTRGVCHVPFESFYSCVPLSVGAVEPGGSSFDRPTNGRKENKT